MAATREFVGSKKRCPEFGWLAKRPARSADFTECTRPTDQNTRVRLAFALVWNIMEESVELIAGDLAAGAT